MAIIDYFCLFFMFSGPISSILVNKYGSRPVMMVGGLLSGSGFVAASFCNSIQALYFCVGVMGGLCLSDFYIFIFKFDQVETNFSQT